MTTTTAPLRGALVDTAGRPLHLGGEIGRGAEGSVYEILDAPESVAKLYHDVVNAEQSAKLAAMVRGARPALTEVAAWPTATLHARGRAVGAGAPVLGLVMPRASGALVHRLYSPISRKTEFPTVDWQRLVIVAHNLAAAMAQVHAAGHVIGDVNQGNVLVAREGRVRLIDCDSFQIRDGSRWFPCEVGVGHFTPPELQGKSFAGIARTPNHDAFGLAVLVFHLLFMGRHPFAGRYAGKGEMPLEQAIADFRFAFGRNASTVQMAPPPNALPLASASADVADLFERAFGREGVWDGARPTAAEWKTALGALAKDVATCAVMPGHKYPRGLGACPWCAIANAGGPDFFASVLVNVQHLAGFNAVEVWTAILGIPAPEASPAIPTALTTAPASAQQPTAPVPRWRRLTWRSHRFVAAAAGGAFVAGTVGGSGAPAEAVAAGLLLLFFGLRRGSGLAGEHDRRRREVEAARTRLQSMEERWTRELGGAAGQFAAKRQELDAMRSEYLQLDTAKRRGRQELEAKRREHQLQQYLDGHFVASSGVPGIGTGRAATLASYGIETAADVTYAAVVAVPGFGGKRANDLVAWRQFVEKTFLFDSSKSVDPAELAALEARFARRRNEIERALAAGPGALRQLGGATAQLRDRLVREIGAQQVAVGAATANVVAVVGRAFPNQRLAVLAWGAAAVLGLTSGNTAARVFGHSDRGEASGSQVVQPQGVAPGQGPIQPSSSAALPGSATPTGRTSSGTTYFEFQVEKQAATVPGSLSAAYPEMLKLSGGDGKVTVQFVVDTMGLADMRTWKVLETTNDLFTQAAKDGVSRARFYPAEIGGKKVKQLVQLPFTFNLTR